jgi:hypothetical protein
MAALRIGFGEDGPDGAGGAKKALERVFSPELRNPWTRPSSSLTQTRCGPPRGGQVPRRDRRPARERRVALEVTDEAKDGVPSMATTRPSALARWPASSGQTQGRLADELLFGKLETGGTARVGVKDGEIAIRHGGRGAGGSPTDAGDPAARRAGQGPELDRQESQRRQTELPPRHGGARDRGARPLVG